MKCGKYEGHNIIKMYNDGSLLQKFNMVRLGKE